MSPYKEAFEVRHTPCVSFGIRTVTYVGAGGASTPEGGVWPWIKVTISTSTSIRRVCRSTGMSEISCMMVYLWSVSYNPPVLSVHRTNMCWVLRLGLARIGCHSYGSSCSPFASWGGGKSSMIRRHSSLAVRAPSAPLSSATFKESRKEANCARIVSAGSTCTFSSGQLSSKRERKPIVGNG